MLVPTTVALLTFLLGMAFEEAILKPLVIKFTQSQIKKFVKPTLNVLDEKIKLPNNWESFIQEKEDWVMSAIIPEVKETIPEDKIKEVVFETLKEFDMKTFLSKVGK